MKKEWIEKAIEMALNYGADFVELYIEKKISKSYSLSDKVLDDIHIDVKKGVGLRLLQDNIVYYGAFNEVESEEKFYAFVSNLLFNLDKREKKISFSLGAYKEKLQKVKIPHDSFLIDQKISYLKEADRIARSYSDKIYQTSMTLLEGEKDFMVANSNGTYVHSNQIVTRFIANIFSQDDSSKAQRSYMEGASSGYELLETFDLEKVILKTAKSTVEKLYATSFEGGMLPVILGPGFGAVIFHEACGHALEATSVAPHISVFDGKLNTNIASSKVTLIDDGTIPGMWGSVLVDDEGNESKRNILIENGILKSYLIDEVGARKMGQSITGSGRRQDFRFAPTSRMNNTFLAPGTDKIDDMIKSIDLGVYCKEMCGGQVNTATGEFNFLADECYLIQDGKVGPRIKGVTLIGTGQEILKEVEMVSSDLKLATGYCGSQSGLVYVTIGQPTIKIGKILVGGSKE